MSYPINYPTPQGANVQIFNAVNSSTAGNATDWIKPQGASFVWFTLIGSGGVGTGTVGGGSGAVTNFMCPAFLIPDMLRVRVSDGIGSGSDTRVVYQQKNDTGYVLLSAAAANGSTAGTAMTANAFTAMGFFQSVAGQAGTGTAQSPSATTFLSGGAATASTYNYGYSLPSNAGGTFMLQPIIVGIGGILNQGAGIGCGGGSAGVRGSAGGLAVIITW